MDKKKSIYKESLLIHPSEVSEQERAFGDWSSGRKIWVAEYHRQINVVPYRGQQGMFDVSFDLIK